MVIEESQSEEFKWETNSKRFVVYVITDMTMHRLSTMIGLIRKYVGLISRLFPYHKNKMHPLSTMIGQTLTPNRVMLLRLCSHMV